MNMSPMAGKVFVHNFKKGERKIGSIIISNDDGKAQGIRPRWAQVLATANDVTSVSAGQWLLIDHGRWSRSINMRESNEESDETLFDETEFWQVDYPKGILCVSEVEPDDTIMIDTNQEHQQHHL